MFLTSNYKVLIGDFAPIKPFCLQSKNQSPIEFYQIWFDEGLDGETDEIGRGCYLAPERLKFNSVENFEASDLFSLGCALVEIFGSRAFLQFKDLLALGNVKSSEEYEALLQKLILKAGLDDLDVLTIIKRLCARDPLERKLLESDLELIQSKIDSEISNWRQLLDSYRISDNFKVKKEIISKFPSTISRDLDSFLLLCLKEKDPILAVLLVNFILKTVKDVGLRNELLKTFKTNFSGFKFVENCIEESQIVDNFNEYPLIQAFNSVGEYKSELKEIVELASRRLSVEKLMSVLNKLLQIYRKREVFDSEFEARIAFEYLRIEAQEEDLELLFKVCRKFHEKYAENEKFSSSRIAFKLDLGKNKVPIESNKKSSNWFMKRSDIHDRSPPCVYPKLKQRLLNEPIKWTERIIGILQSPDKSFIIGYTETTLHFWDMKKIIRSKEGEPSTSVNPRADAVITYVIFGKESDSLIISFQDGIIGLYK